MNEQRNALLARMLELEAVVERYENDLGKQRRYTGEVLRERDEARAEMADALNAVDEWRLRCGVAERERETLLAVVERYENALRIAREFVVGVDLHGTDPAAADVWRWATFPVIDDALAGTEESGDDGLTPIATPWRNT